MSAQAGLSRRQLLGLFRRREQPAPVKAPAPVAPAVNPPEPASGGGFSLEAFYAARAQSGAGGTGMPVFSLREGLAVPQEGTSHSGPRVDPHPGPLPEGEGTSTGPTRAVPLAARAVRVRPSLCLAWQGSFCSTCSERCPVEGAIAVEVGRPRVVEERCDGCGLCVQVCPSPLNAFEFVAARTEVVP